MGLGIAPQIGSMMQNANPNNTPPTKPCPKCNTQIPINVKFCSNCGSPMELKCPNCNTVLATGAKFCPECGTKV